MLILIDFTFADFLPPALLSTSNLISISSVMSIEFSKGLKDKSHAERPGGTPARKPTRDSREKSF